jgi:intein/homing endonuclease
VVERLITPTADSLITITLSDGSSVTSTHEHPYYVNGKGWSSYDPVSTEYLHDMNVNKLEINDELMTKDGTYLIITNISLENVDSIKVYNFEVNGNHNYFANNLLVHNKNRLRIYEDTTFN